MNHEERIAESVVLKPDIKPADGETVHVPCPVCDADEGVIRGLGQKFWIECETCKYSTPQDKDWEKVLNDWGNGGMAVVASKSELGKKSVEELKAMVAKDSWIALKQYFDGKGNGAQAKVACVVIGTIAKEEQTRNAARQLDLIERRISLESKTLGAGV